LVSDSLTNELIPSKGLRQGNLLVPFLFLIVVEGLVGLERQALRKNILVSIRVGKKEVEDQLLQFANDTLIFCKVNTKNILVVKGF